MDKNTYEIRFCELISASLGLTALRAEGCGIAAFGGDEYIVSVTGLALLSPVLHDGVPKPPSFGRGCRRRRRRIADFRRKSQAPQGPDVAHS